MPLSRSGFWRFRSAVNLPIVFILLADPGMPSDYCISFYCAVCSYSTAAKAGPYATEFGTKPEDVIAALGLGIACSPYYAAGQRSATLNFIDASARDLFSSSTNSRTAIAIPTGSPGHDGTSGLCAVISRAHLDLDCSEPRHSRRGRHPARRIFLRQDFARRAVAISSSAAKSAPQAA